MVYCASDMSKKNGFASYIKNALTVAFVVSILSERALILTGCADAQLFGVEPDRDVDAYLKEYFEGRGFSWRPHAAHLKANPRARFSACSHADLRGTKPGEKCAYTRDKFMGKTVPNNTTVLYYATEFTGIDKVFGDSMNLERFVQLVGWDPKNASNRPDVWTTCNACAYQYLLAPTRRLKELENAFVKRNGIARAADGGLAIRLLEARLGEEMDVRMFFPETPSAKVWEKHRSNAMWKDPVSGFACLEHLGPGVPVVITDAAWVADCAVANGIATTGGFAVHPAPIGVAWPHNYRTSDLDKYILDWWLMWQSTRGGTLNENNYPGGLMMTARYSSFRSYGDGHWPSASNSFPAGCNRTKVAEYQLNLTAKCEPPVLPPALKPPGRRQLTADELADNVMALQTRMLMAGVAPPSQLLAA